MTRQKYTKKLCSYKFRYAGNFAGGDVHTHTCSRTHTHQAGTQSEMNHATSNSATWYPKPSRNCAVAHFSGIKSLLCLRKWTPLHCWKHLYLNVSFFPSAVSWACFSEQFSHNVSLVSSWVSAYPTETKKKSVPSVTVLFYTLFLNFLMMGFSLSSLKTTEEWKKGRGGGRMEGWWGWMKMAPDGP